MSEMDKKVANYGTPSLVDMAKKFAVYNIRNKEMRLSSEQKIWQRSIMKLSGQPAVFDTDNLLTNEWSTAQPLDVIWNEDNTKYGCFIGNGVFQNFTYAGAINVSQIVILDIRQTNIAYALLMLDLLQNCSTSDRFISHMLCRPNCSPQNGPWNETPTHEEVSTFLKELDVTSFDKEFMYMWVDRVTELANTMISGGLIEEYISVGWTISFLRFCIEHFARFGLDLTFITWGLGITNRHPSLAHVISTRSPVHSYPTFFLSPLIYTRIRKLANDWKIIPIVGDLGDPTWGRRIREWTLLEDPVRAIYSSNVENYLVSRGSWEVYDNYITSLRQLPVEEDTVIIKSYFQYSDLLHPLQLKGRHDCVFVHKLSDLFNAYESGVLKEPEDVFLAIRYLEPISPITRS